MKNVKMIWMGMVSLLSVGAFATTQTMIAGSDATPITVNAGIGAKMGAYRVSNDDKGFGFSGMGAAVGVNHYAFNNFEYGATLKGGYGAVGGKKLFLKDGVGSGFMFGLDLAARYMPEIATNMRLGGVVDVGYGRLFGEKVKDSYEKIAFGDLHFNVGPAFQHHVTDMFSYSVGLTGGMSAIRFSAKDRKEEAKKGDNMIVVKLPVNFLVQATEKTGVVFGVEPSWMKLPKHDELKWHHGVAVEACAGVQIGF
jgi:hypothetical protein